MMPSSDFCKATDKGRTCVRKVNHPGHHSGYRSGDAEHMENWGMIQDSERWCAMTGILVLDPDGWDRLNLTDSWAERITEEVFNYRVSRSTINIHGRP